MQKIKDSFIILLAISLPLVLSSCSRYKEPAPFFDGLFLEYRYVNRDIKTIYNVMALTDNRFKIVRKTPWNVLKDDIDEFIVDIYGRVYESNSKRYKGKFSDIWIPVHKMEIGETFDEGFTVLRKERWREWKVLVIKNPLFEQEGYFDLNTGYWVGSKGRTPKGAYEIVLVDTNADISVEEVDE